MTTVHTKDLKKAIKTAALACRGLNKQYCYARVAIQGSGYVSVACALTRPVVTVWIGASNLTEVGNIVVPAESLIELADKLAGKATDLAISDGSLIATADGARYVLDMADVDFPSYSGLASDAFRADVRVFRKVLKHCAESTATHQLSLDTVYMHVDGDRLVMSSTDGYRVHEHTIVVEGVALSDLITVRAKDAKILAEAMTGKQVAVSLLHNLVIFSMDGVVEVCVSMTNAKQPPYQDIIPRKAITRFEVKADELYQAAKRLSRVAKMAVLRLRDRELMVYSGDVCADALLAIRVEQVNGIPTRTVAFNPKYLADILEPLSGTVEIWIGETAMHPVFVKTEGFRGLLSPMDKGTISDEDNALRRAHHAISASQSLT